MTVRYANVTDDVISVCERKSDIFDYIDYKDKHQKCFVVRARYESLVTKDGYKLTAYINQALL